MPTGECKAFTERGLHLRLAEGWPLHYLALIEQKTNALDQAAPLADWELPDSFIVLRRLLEARMGKKGTREFVQILRLLETFQMTDIEAGIKSALERGTIGFDAVPCVVQGGTSPSTA